MAVAISSGESPWPAISTVVIRIEMQGRPIVILLTRWRPLRSFRHILLQQFERVQLGHCFSEIIGITIAKAGFAIIMNAAHTRSTCRIIVIFLKRPHRALFILRLAAFLLLRPV